MGGLRLDSIDAILKGGDSGAAIQPGAPEQSLLIKAISYTDLRLKMPPKGKLSDEEIAVLIEWVKMGSPAARAAQPSSTPQPERKKLDFAEGRKFWCFRPLQDPSIPPVRQKDWPRSPVDSFILARLEEKGLAPAPPADKLSWLRRVTFDLTGLPPAPLEIESFASDDSTDARRKVVERLLASPHYGERWGRHWLDLVRFAETNGHEFDNDKLDAWRYRDYVIRAFNDDLPYDQFVREHIAGDLIPEKRISSDGAQWESPVATSFYWFGEVLNSATDSVKSRADEVDNQIDVMSKTFLGLTVACARCHDHKFDPIPTSDYYSLAGMMHSTGITESAIDSPTRAREIASLHQRIVDVNTEISALLRPARLKLAKRLKAYLLAASGLIAAEGSERPHAAEDMAAARNLNADLLKAWATYLTQASKDPAHPFHPFALLSERAGSLKAPSFSDAVAAVRNDLQERVRRSNPVHPSQKTRGDIVFEDFEKLSYEGWTVSGQAFGDAPQREVAPNQNLRGYQGQGMANSFRGGSDRLVGSLTSEKFRMPKLYVHVRMAGSPGKRAGEKSGLRFTIVADGHKSEHLVPDGNDGLEWKTVRMTKEIGRLCYFEIVDRSREGHIVVDKIVISDSKEPPELASNPNKHILALLSQPGLDSLEALAEAYQRLFTGVLEHGGAADRDDRALALALLPTGRVEDAAFFLSETERKELASLVEKRSLLDARLPESAFAMIAREDSPRNIRVHIRGNHKNLGEETPRRYLQVLAGEDQKAIERGSGRLELAEWTASPENPLTARVMVNRIWKHHFGQGLVRTVDNFGKTGEEPTHPELLDFLARRFMESGWSVKEMHRLLLLSSAYAMSSRANEAALKADPQNKLLHHIPVRRMEGEVIRDSILAVSGRLDRRLFGPSVPPHISKYQDGRGKPEPGPLDGEGRRSIYIQVRRNFITPMFLAFDYPLPITTIGNRSVSTVPSQALMMMNSEFIAQQAEEWARRLCAAESEPRKRVEQMFRTAFARPAERAEISGMLQFVNAQKSHYEGLAMPSRPPSPDLQAWADGCHVLFNSAEFIYVR